MTFNKFKIIAMTLKVSYPDQVFLPTEEAIKVWYEMLGDLEYEILLDVVQKFIQTSDFKPTIAKLRRAYAESTGENYIHWTDMWRKVISGEIDSLNKPARYAVDVIGGFYYINYVLNERLDKIEFIYKEFKDIYSSYVNQDIVNRQVQKHVRTHLLNHCAGGNKLSTIAAYSPCDTTDLS